MSALEKQNIRSAVDGSTTYFELKDITLAVYCTYLGKGRDTGEDLNAIREAKEKSDYLIVYFLQEATLAADPEEWMQYTLRHFADAGASLLVGSGSNVLQPIENYKDSIIAYSIGTLLDGTSFLASNPSAALRLTLKSGNDAKIAAELQLIPCSPTINRWQPAVLPEGNEKSEVLAMLTAESEIPLTER